MLKSHSKPKQAAVGKVRKNSASSESSAESESDSEKSQVSPDEDDELAAGRLDSQHSAKQFAAEVSLSSFPVLAR